VYTFKQYIITPKWVFDIRPIPDMEELSVSCTVYVWRLETQPRSDNQESVVWIDQVRYTLQGCFPSAPIDGDQTKARANTEALFRPQMALVWKNRDSIAW